MKELMIFDFIDDCIAIELGVEAEVYIDIVENLSEWRRNIIVGAFFSENQDKLDQVKRIFKNHLIK